MIYDFILDVITTLIGVVIGGFIAIKSSNIVNSKLLKKEHLLNLLQKIKISLDGWSKQILLDSTNVYECKNVSTLKVYTLSPDLQTVVAYFDTNIVVLKNFKIEFEKLRNEDITFQQNADNLKMELMELAKKYNEIDVEKLYAYDECAKIIESYASQIFKLHVKIVTLVSNIDSYINTKLLN